MTSDADSEYLVSDDVTLRDLRNYVGRYAPLYGFTRVFLFGSRARGDFTEDSDYDCCVVTGEDCDLLSLGGFLEDMHDCLGKEISVVSKNGLKPYFFKSVEPDMRLLYEV